MQGGSVIGTPLRIAICEDDRADLESLLRAIENSGCRAEADSFADGAALMGAFEKGRYDIVFLDIYMPAQNGVATAHAIRGMDSRVVIVFVTSSPDHTREGYRLGALKYIEKPFMDNAVKEAWTWPRA